MKKLTRLTILLFVVCLTFTSCDQPLTDAQKGDIEKELTELTHEIFNQFNSRDTAEMYSSYYDDCIVLSRGGYLIKDPGEFEKYTSKAKLSIADRDPFELKISDLQVDVYSKDVASVYYKYSSTVSYENGVNIKHNAVNTWTFVKKDGEWKIQHAHISSGKDSYRAVEGEPVWVLINHVKADKTEVFEQFMHGEFFDKAKELGGLEAAVINSVRILHPKGPNNDGSYTYVFIMDPYIPGVNYDIRHYLSQMYDEVEAKEKYKLFEESLVEPQSGYFVLQSKY